MLFRPFVLSRANSHSIQADQRDRAAQKTRSSATTMNSFLERVFDLDLVEYLSPSVYAHISFLRICTDSAISISPLILAMQIHLLDCKSSIRSVSRLGHHRLQLCMMVQAELKETYWGADGAFRLFEQAQNKLLKNTSRRNSTAVTSTGSDIEAVDPMTQYNLHPTVSHESQQITPSVDDLLTFDLAFTDLPEFNMYDMGYL